MVEVGSEGYDQARSVLCKIVATKLCHLKHNHHWEADRYYGRAEGVYADCPRATGVCQS